MRTKTIPVERESVRRNCSRFPAAALREIAGSVADAIATPICDRAEQLARYAKVNVYQAQLFAKFLQKLRDIGIEPLDVYDALNGRNRSLLFNPMRRSDHE